jgi:hypothetical protein
MVRLGTWMPSLRGSPRIRSAPQSRLFVAICPIRPGEPRVCALSAGDLQLLAQESIRARQLLGRAEAIEEVAQDGSGRRARSSAEPVAKRGNRRGNAERQALGYRCLLGSSRMQSTGPSNDESHGVSSRMAVAVTTPYGSTILMRLCSASSGTLVQVRIPAESITDSDASRSPVRCSVCPGIGVRHRPVHAHATSLPLLPLWTSGPRDPWTPS